MLDFGALPIARYRFTFCVTEPIHTQLYAGSVLRGVFGHALRQLSCVTKAEVCTGCPLIAQCPYTAVFSPHEIDREWDEFKKVRQIPVPYLIEPPALGTKIYQKDDEFTFNMVLMGKSLEHLALIILAWRRALLRGIGKLEGKAELQNVEHINIESSRSIYSAEFPKLTSAVHPLNIPQYKQSKDVHLIFKTPLRIQKDKIILGAREMTAAIFLRNLIRRVSLVAQFQLGKPLYFDVHLYNSLADQVADERRLRWLDWSRYSSRQKQRMELGGLLGHWLLLDVPPEILAFLYLGQWLHVGKETSFGMGHYEITEMNWAPRFPNNAL